jgi:hypothetical protein
MSFGKSNSSSQQQQQAQSTSSSQLNPQILSDLLSNYNNEQTMAAQPYQPFTGEQVAPLNAIQQQAQAGVLGIAANNTGNAELNNAISSTANVAGYNPQMITPSAYTAATGAASLQGPAATAAAAQINPSSIQQVTAPTVGADQINAYLNPYTSDVVNTTDAQMLQQEQINQAANNAAATRAGAFGGSGSAVQNALTNQNYQLALGSTNANLNSAGYAQALAAAQQQAAAQQAAATSNQGTNLAAGTTNATLAQQVALANQAAANSQAQFNAGQGQNQTQFNSAAQNAAAAQAAAQAQAAAAANQSAGLAGAGLQLQAGAQQGQLSAQQLGQALGIQNAVAGVGAQSQAVQQAQDSANYQNYLNAQNWPLMLQQLTNQTLGLAGNPTTSQSQSTSSGSGKSSSSSESLNLSSLAPLAL